MKKILCVILVFVILLPTFVFADSKISVTLDGEKLSFDVEPALIDGRTMVPIRAIFEAMGATVEWDNDTQSAICTKGDTVVKMTIDSPTIYINDVPSQMDTSPVIINGRTLAPARFVAESFGYKVDWDNENSIAKITSVVSEPEKEPEAEKDTFAIDILDKDVGSFYMPYQSGLPELGKKGINFQNNNEEEEIFLNIESKASFTKNETYCNLNGISIGESNPDYLWLTGTITINVHRMSKKGLIIGELINLDNFYWEDGSRFEPLYYEIFVSIPKEIKNLSDANRETEIDMNDMLNLEIEPGEEKDIKFEILTDRVKGEYPVLRILYNNGEKAKYMHLRKGVPANYKNKEYLNPKKDTPQLTLSKEECKAKITELKNAISTKKEELNVAFSELNENKAVDIQNKINALELELKKYEDYLKTFE